MPATAAVDAGASVIPAAAASILELKCRKQVFFSGGLCYVSQIAGGRNFEEKLASTAAKQQLLNELSKAKCRIKQLTTFQNNRDTARATALHGFLEGPTNSTRFHGWCPSFRMKRSNTQRMLTHTLPCKKARALDSNNGGGHCAQQKRRCLLLLQQRILQNPQQHNALGRSSGFARLKRKTSCGGDREEESNQIMEELEQASIEEADRERIEQLNTSVGSMPFNTYIQMEGLLNVRKKHRKDAVPEVYVQTAHLNLKPFHCTGCGVSLQTRDSSRPSYISPAAALRQNCETEVCSSPLKRRSSRRVSNSSTVSNSSSDTSARQPEKRFADKGGKYKSAEDFVRLAAQTDGADFHEFAAALAAASGLPTAEVSEKLSFACDYNDEEEGADAVDLQSGAVAADGEREPADADAEATGRDEEQKTETANAVNFSENSKVLGTAAAPECDVAAAAETVKRSCSLTTKSEEGNREAEVDTSESPAAADERIPEWCLSQVRGGVDLDRLRAKAVRLLQERERSREEDMERRNTGNENNDWSAKGEQTNVLRDGTERTHPAPSVDGGNLLNFERPAVKDDEEILMQFGEADVQFGDDPMPQSDSGKKHMTDKETLHLPLKVSDAQMHASAKGSFFCFPPKSGEGLKTPVVLNSSLKGKEERGAERSGVRKEPLLPQDSTELTFFENIMEENHTEDISQVAESIQHWAISNAKNDDGAKRSLLRGEDRADSSTQHQMEVSPAQRQLLCQRCHAIRSGKAIAEHLRVGFGSDELLQPERFRRLIGSLRTKRCIYLLLLDITSPELLPDLRSLVRVNPLYVAVTKCDLLPGALKRTDVCVDSSKGGSGYQRQCVAHSGTARQYMFNLISRVYKGKEFSVKNVFMISSKSGAGLTHLINAVGKEATLRKRPVYIIGAANAGKTSFINRVVSKSAKISESTILKKPRLKGAKAVAAAACAVPGTTLDFIPAIINNRWRLIDTPGIFLKGSYSNILTQKELQVALPTSSLHRISANVKENSGVWLGGLVRIELLSEKGCFLSFFVSRSLPLLPFSKGSNYNENRSLKQRRLLFPPSSAERLEELSPLYPVDFMVNGLGWINTAAEIVISGLGWISVTGCGILRLRVFVPKEVRVYERPPLVPRATRACPPATNERFYRAAKLKLIE